VWKLSCAVLPRLGFFIVCLRHPVESGGYGTIPAQKVGVRVPDSVNDACALHEVNQC